MKRKLIPVLVANLFVAAPALAQDFTLTGSVGVGGQYVDTSNSTTDQGKLREYRDMEDGLLTVIDLKGRSSRYYLDFFGENLGRDDMFLDLKGGAYGTFKYQLYSDSMKHVFTTGARSAYSGIGTANQTVATTYVPTIPPTPPSTTPGGNFFRLTDGGNLGAWNSYDSEYKRRNDGGMVEFSFGTPFYVRAEANQLRFDGNKLQSYAQGTSPGNGFVDFAVPVDYKTKNFSVELGYSTKAMHLALNYLKSDFENKDSVLRWTNAYFANGTDSSPLPPDNEYTRWSANATFKQLPLGSSLGLRYTTSKSESNVNVLSTILNTGTGTPIVPTNPSTNASSPTFNGDVKYDTWSITLSSNPVRMVDTRLYYNSFKKENDSTHLSFTGLPAGLNCADQFNGAAPPTCEPELFSYKKKNYGLDVGIKVVPGNKVNLIYDFSDVERERFDTHKTEETKYGIEYRNTMLDNVTARFKYQRLERESDFLFTEAFVRARAAQPQVPGVFTFTNQTQGFIEGFVRRYDVANLDQDLFKIAVDFAPTPLVDLGVEFSTKKNKYREVVLGRTKDDREELYLSASFGDKDVFRVTAFLGFERIQYTSYHRVGNPLDPLLPPTLPAPPSTTSPAYNWEMTITDRYSTAGLGFDWPVADALTFKGSLLWGRTEGRGEFVPQTLSNGNPANPALLSGGINNYGNNESFSVNAKGIYRFSKALEFTLGAAYEEMKFNDIQFNNYTYAVPLSPINNTTSYLSGWYANPDYKAAIAYVIAKYRF